MLENLAILVLRQAQDCGSSGTASRPTTAAEILYFILSFGQGNDNEAFLVKRAIAGVKG